MIRTMSVLYSMNNLKVKKDISICFEVLVVILFFPSALLVYFNNHLKIFAAIVQTLQEFVDFLII